MPSRRGFLLTATSAAFGSGILSGCKRPLSPQPLNKALKAAAVDPATAVIVAKTGLDVYRMVKGGGGGGENLLMAQTEMLRALSGQIVVVNAGIQEIIAGVEGLKSLIRDLPSETVRALASSDVQAAFTNISEKLERLALLRERYGQVYALSQVEGDAAINLGRLEHSRAALMGDESPLTIPLVCTAWYVEFQALASLVPFERERILSIARSYKRWAERQMPKIQALIEQTAKDAQVVTKAAGQLRNAPSGVVCYSTISRRARSNFLKILAKKYVIRYGATAVELVPFATHFDELTFAGIAVTPELRTFRETTTDFGTEEISTGLILESPSGPVATNNDFRMVQEWKRMVLSAQCPDPKVYGRPNAEKFDLASKAILERSLMHYHFQLAHHEAYKSITRVIERLTRTTSS